MKVVMKKLLSIVLTIMLLSVFFSAAYAEDSAGTDKRWNIMLVVDGSGSLFSGPTTDPDGLRYEAIDDLLGILQDDGNYVGAMVFSANSSNDDSDEHMLSGIRMNTGMIPFDSKAPDGGDPKDYINSALRNAPMDYGTGGTTDIGTALLVATETLKEAQAQNGLKSIVFLFTDGVTELNYPDTYEKSLENMHSAEEMMLENQIQLCGVFLNKDGQSNSTEVRDMVCAANGYDNNTLDLGDLYIEIEDSASCHAAMEKFMRLLNFSISPAVPVPGVVTFKVPGTGVEEASIRIYSTDGSTLPKDLSVSITSPSGKEFSGATLEGICRSGRTFKNYKLVNPDVGIWEVAVDTKDGESVGVVCELVFAMSREAIMESNPKPDELHSNMDVRVSAYLGKDGVKVTDMTEYDGYQCYLVIKDQKTGEETLFEIPQESNGQFAKTFHLDTYGSYEVYVQFVCDSISIQSDSAVWELENRPPHVYMSSLNIKYGLFLRDTYTYNTEDDIYDDEDGHDLTVTMDSDSCNLDAISFDGTNMIVDAANIGDGTIEVTATDSQGLSDYSYLYVRTQNITLWLILLILLVIAVAFAVVVLVMRNRPKLEGKFTLTFSVEDDSGLSANLQLPLPLPGLDCKSGENLYRMIKIQDGKEYLKDICRRAGVSEEKTRSYLDDNSGLLKQVKFSVKSGKDDAGRVAILVMYYDKEKTEMLRDTKVIASGSERFTINYQAPRRQAQGFDEKKQKRHNPHDDF